ncbi:LysR family transcriptional regulator [Azotosporobacter soli]|uniref:LysR family transcriptional regulator n=1 Tax=Azotosporobacter soli TaxID=3055040 RepID=UPI0031FEC546
MENRDWLILQELYAKKNITKTAQTLFISQPALTARLRQIEKEFAVQIVHRTSKGVKFTPQGEYLAKTASKMLVDLRTVKETVTNMGSTVSGTLRIGASSYFTTFILPSLLRHFKDRYPAVEFKVTTGWSREVYQQVYNQDVHVGFARADYEWQNEKHLLFEENVCVASLTKIALEDLPNLPRIDFKTDYVVNAATDTWWRNNFSQPPLISMEVDRLVTCKEMVINGLGYAIMPDMILRSTPDIHKILLHMPDGQPLIRKTWMIHQKDVREMNVVKAFIEFVENMDFKNTIMNSI